MMLMADRLVLVVCVALWHGVSSALKVKFDTAVGPNSREFYSCSTTFGKEKI